MNSTLTIRIDEDTKQEFTDIVNALGLDTPTVVRMLIQQTIRQKAIPLSLSLQRDSFDTTVNFLDEVHADWGDW
ncbi:hypothetical protein AGMMS49587_18670 [Spirochaetia bacterium]|nr:hypothetical protein AGMMS49587_18670 [Spirochaetia bacterium]